MALPQLAEQRLSLEVCCACGVEFAMPVAMQERLRRTHALFYCPAGHGQHYTAETAEEKARKEVERLTRRLEFKQHEVEAANRATEREQRRASAAKGVTTKLRKRIATGKCPCCRASFADLREHIASEHPDYAEAR